jgi:hypothetical protein
MEQRWIKFAYRVNTKQSTARAEKRRLGTLGVVHLGGRVGYSSGNKSQSLYMPFSHAVRTRRADGLGISTGSIYVTTRVQMPLGNARDADASK